MSRLICPAGESWGAGETIDQAIAGWEKSVGYGLPKLASKRRSGCALRISNRIGMAIRRPNAAGMSARSTPRTVLALDRATSSADRS